MPGRHQDKVAVIRDNVTRMRRAWEAERDALATVRRFNARLSAERAVWFWPKITAALTAKHPWLVIACDSCGTVVDLDSSVKPRDPEASVRVALRDVRCPRCNGYGRPRIVALAQYPSIWECVSCQNGTEEITLVSGASSSQRA